MAESLARRSSESSAIEVSSKISRENFMAITSWVTMICEHKRMEMPQATTLERTWLEPLKSYRPSVIDWAFRDYLSNGEGEFFEVHAITKRCKLYLAQQEGDRSGLPKGCVNCRWTGFIYTDQQMRRVRPCPCRKDPKLQTPYPMPTECDYSDVVEMAKETLSSKMPAMPNVPAGGNSEPSGSSVPSPVPDVEGSSE